MIAFIYVWLLEKQRALINKNPGQRGTLPLRSGGLYQTATGQSCHGEGGFLQWSAIRTNPSYHSEEVDCREYYIHVSRFFFSSGAWMWMMACLAKVETKFTLRNMLPYINWFMVLGYLLTCHEKLGHWIHMYFIFSCYFWMEKIPPLYLHKSLFMTTF